MAFELALAPSFTMSQTKVKLSLLGSFVPFAPTKAAREAARDPRKSVEERYASRDEYLSRVQQAGEALVMQGFLLADDVERVRQRASDTWDLVVGRESSVGDRR